MTTCAPSPAVEDLTLRILATPKYRHLDEGLVRRFAAESLAARDRPAEALKLAKRRLHQAFGAFLVGSPAAAVHRAVDAVAGGDADLRSACLAAMRGHVSTAERIDHLDELYGTVGEWCGPVSSVVDVACGLNPLAVPWMRLAPGARYACCDIDRNLAAALARLGEVLPVAVRATTCDLVVDDPTAGLTGPVELALVLKTATTLEQQRPGATADLLRRLTPAAVVLSVPTRSIGARRAYERDAGVFLDGLRAGTAFRPAAEATFGAERVWHLVAGDG